MDGTERNIFFPTGIPPLSIAFNGKNRFKVRFREKGKRAGAVLVNPLRILAVEYPLWGENLTPLIFNSSSKTGFNITSI
jgi:hypothetical protein